MTAFASLPADGIACRWALVDADGQPLGREELTLTWENEAWTAVGRIEHATVEYVVRLSPLWQARQALLFRDLAEPDLWLGTDGAGHWGEVNGAHRPDLDLATEVAVADSPFRHTPALRRLDLSPGQTAVVRMLTIDPETLGVLPSDLAYTCIDARRYIVADAAGETELDVDDHGLAVTVANSVTGADTSARRWLRQEIVTPEP